MRLTVERFADHLERSGLIPPGRRVLVALSGGRDSVALLRLLVVLREDRRLDVRAAHLDHRMRPDSSRDAAWVAGLCRAWNVPLVAASALHPPASEAAARAIRYHFLRSAARATRSNLIATAHHRDDQAETVLLRVLRGTGVRGLRGVAPRRGRIVRPLLPFDRGAIDAYVDEAGLAWREDPSNADGRWLRNRVRAALMPALGPEAARAAAEVAGRAAVVERSWRSVTDGLERSAVTANGDGFLIAAAPVAGYDPASRARLLRRLCRRMGVVPGRAATRLALELFERDAPAGPIDLGGGLTLERGFRELRLSRTAREPEPDVPARIEGGRGAASATIGSRRWNVAWSRADAADVANVRANDGLVLPADALPLVLRAWQPGDRIRLKSGSRKLKKLFNDWRVERPDRARTAVLADATGRVLWIPGRAIASDATVAPGYPLLRIRVTEC